MNWVGSSFVVIYAGVMEPLRHHVKGYKFASSIKYYSKMDYVVSLQ